MESRLNSMKNKEVNLIFGITSIFILLPLAIIIILASGKAWFYPNIIPQQINFGAYFRFLLTNQELISSLWESISLAFGTILLTLIIPYPTAIALSHYDFRGRKLLNLLIYLPLIIPSTALITNMDFMMIKYGINGSYFGVVSVHCMFCLPYAIKLLEDNLALYGDKYEGVSTNLGANWWQTFIRVTLPLSKNGLKGAILMTYIVSMTQYLATLMIGDGKYLTLSVRMFPFTQAGRYKIAAIYAITFLIVTIIPLYIIEKVLIFRRGRHLS